MINNTVLHQIFKIFLIFEGISYILCCYEEEMFQLKDNIRIINNSINNEKCYR